MSTNTFLFELGTEELPPKALPVLSQALETEFLNGLKGLLGAQADALISTMTITRFAAPRRLALQIENMVTETPANEIVVHGPPVKIAYDAEGNPSKALQGFARKCGTTVDALSEDQGKVCFRQTEAAAPIADKLPELISAALDKLPIPKRMRWGASRAEFVRPVKWSLMLLGSEVVPGSVMGHENGRTTYGHRFHHPAAIEVADASQWATLLKEQGYVQPHFEQRKEQIRAQLLAEGEKIDGAQVVISESLLAEVTALNEWPVALTGRFEESFLAVPSEALISTMADNQKYFHLLDAAGKLLPYFITIANLESKDPAQVIAGNEKVVRPRLADAAFFFETDKKSTLESRQDALKKIVFQKDLGTIYEKCERVAATAAFIAEQIGTDPALAQRAAMLCKADLTTEMVLEFPELQGLMGYHYATHDGEDALVAQAAQEHYFPRFQGDQLPSQGVAISVALADRLDTLTGLFGINQPPTGSKDPFALRRASLGVLRIMVESELDLDLHAALSFAAAQHADLPAGAEATASKVFEFMLERFRAWYEEKGIAPEIYLSVVALKPSKPLDFENRVRAVQAFSQLDDAAALAAANKRVSNILNKVEGELPVDIDSALLCEAAEIALAQALTEASNQAQSSFDNAAYSDGLATLAGLRPVVDTFFDQVMVNTDDEAVRNNRLALLNNLRNQFLKVADISLLSQ